MARRTHVLLSRYAVVGLGTNILLYLGYLAATSAGTPPKLAMTCLYILGILLGFVLNKTWTFGHRGASIGTFLRYGVAYGVGYAVNWSLLSIFAERMGFPHQIVQAAAVFIVAALIFLILRGWVFLEPAREKTP